MARIHVVMARDSPVAVIFRRGPTKQVRMLSWNRRTDEITGGQWLMGRVYEERSSLSPDGQLLVYFAMRNGKPWTAVSRPPHFTPLAVWEEDSTWGGGGFFAENHRLLLRTNPGALTLDPRFELPAGFVVEALGTQRPDTQRPGLVGLAWTHRKPDATSWLTPSGRARPSSQYAPPIASRARPGQQNMVLEAHPVETEGAYGPFSAQEYVVRELDEDRAHLLGELDWADWDDKGDLLFARGGDVLRAERPERALEEHRVVARLADHRFERMPPGPEALRWPSFRIGSPRLPKKSKRR